MFYGLTELPILGKTQDWYGLRVEIERWYTALSYLEQEISEVEQAYNMDKYICCCVDMIIIHGAT